MITKPFNFAPETDSGIDNYMSRKNNKLTIRSLFWLCLALVTLLFNFLPNNLIDPFSYGQEFKSSVIITKTKKQSIDYEYNSKLAPRFRTLDAVVYYVRKHVPDTTDKLEQFEVLVKLIRQRFVHAYSVYGMQENWIAVMAGRLIWRDLSAKVIPDDILKGEVAACSQVSIVLMEACKRMGIPSRKVGMKGHYAMEAYIDGKWYYSDANLKPDFNAIGGRKSIADILKYGQQFKLYANTVLDSAGVADKFSEIEYGNPNYNPAPRAYFFQATTKELSHWGWIIALGISVYYWRRRKTTDNKKQQFEPGFLQQFQAIIP